MAQNGQLDEPRIELAPLTFPLDRLESLSSLQLALVQFHLDNDEPGFERLVNLARSIWRERREAAIARGELPEGEARHSTPMSRPPSAPVVSPKYAPFVPLVDVLREAHASTPKPLRAKVGLDLKKRDRTVYEGEFATFKSYAAAAEELGIVILGKPAGSGGGRDWIQLNDKYMHASLPIAPADSAPPASIIPSVPPSASHFHLSSLSFPKPLANVAKLNTRRLLLLQFRHDVPALDSSPEGKALFESIQRVYWRRRATLVEQQGQAEPASVVLPSALPKQAYLAVPTYGVQPLAEVGVLQQTTSAILPPLPPLDESLPPFLTAPWYIVEVSRLPSNGTATISAFLPLFPSHLIPFATILYPPSPIAIPGYAMAPLARHAHIAYPSRELAAAAQAHLNTVFLPEDGSGLPAGFVCAAPAPPQIPLQWTWGSVRPKERGRLWSLAAAEAQKAAGTAKRAREEDAFFEREADKKPKLDVQEQVVDPQESVPAQALESFYPLAFLSRPVPRDMRQEHLVDDCFVWRFGAVAYTHNERLHQGFAGECLLFRSAEDRRAFSHWLVDDASRYWRYNHIRPVDMDVADVAKLGWRVADFAPAWRREQGFTLSSTPERGAVGERGTGPAPRDSGREVGWFDFEYVQRGLPVPGAADKFASSASGGSSLFARIGGTAELETESTQEEKPDIRETSSRLPNVLSASDLEPPFPDHASLDVTTPHLSTVFPPSSASLVDPPTPHFPSPAPTPELDDVDAFETPLSVARTYSAPRGSTKRARMSAIALVDFAAELEQVVQEGLKQLGTNVPPEEEEEGEQEGQEGQEAENAKTMAGSVAEDAGAIKQEEEDVTMVEYAASEAEFGGDASAARADAVVRPSDPPSAVSSASAASVVAAASPSGALGNSLVSSPANPVSPLSAARRAVEASRVPSPSQSIAGARSAAPSIAPPVSTIAGSTSLSAPSSQPTRPPAASARSLGAVDMPPPMYHPPVMPHYAGWPSSAPPVPYASPGMFMPFAPPNAPTYFAPHFQPVHHNPPLAPTLARPPGPVHPAIPTAPRAMRFPSARPPPQPSSLPPRPNFAVTMPRQPPLP